MLTFHANSLLELLEHFRRHFDLLRTLLRVYNIETVPLCRFDLLLEPLSHHSTDDFEEVAPVRQSAPFIIGEKLLHRGQASELRI